MAWQAPWFITWLVSWAGLHTPAPPLLSNDVVLDILTPNDIHDCNAGTRCYNISIVNRCVSPDSSTVRSAVLAAEGGKEPTLPGPIISGNKGDRFLINVSNGLTDKSMFTGTTIHWHGIFQNHSRQMDGSAGVSQCVIAPGESFLYNFTGEDQVGTFWYHSHYAVQYCDGLRGAFIIRDPDDPYKILYDYDSDDTIITLMDWYHYPSPVTPRRTWPDSVLVNGIGCYSNDIESCPPPAAFMAEYGKRYRFRLLNMACKTYYNFSIDGHELTVIEVEGTYVEPYTVTSINIHAAQRYSFVFNANQPPCDYKIHAIPNPAEENNSTDTAILRYMSQDGAEKCATVNQPASIPLNEACLNSSYIDSRLLGEPDLNYIVKVSKNNFTYDLLVNDNKYEPPTVPVLLQIMSGWPSDGLEPGKSLVSLDKDKVVQIIFDTDAAGRPHPFHLHGHNFAVIKSADGTCPEPGPHNPILRDTVNTGLDTSVNNVTIRFITNNAGPWFLHCHEEWHFWTGMAIVFVEDYETIQADQGYIDEMKKICTNEPQEYFPLPPMKTADGPYSPPMMATCMPMPLK